MPMETNEDSLFGNIVLEYQFVSKSQLEECLALQKEAPERKLLGEILVERGYLMEKTLKSILSVQRKRLEQKQAEEETASLDLSAGATSETLDLPALLSYAKELGASDLIVTSKSSPVIKKHGRLLPLKIPPLDFPASRLLITGGWPMEQMDDYLRQRTLQFCFTLPLVGRIRANIFRHLSGIAGVYKLLPDDPPVLADLHLPPIVDRLSRMSNGLLLITGPRGCGKTTTMAAILDAINARERHHIITIEDPIEYLLPSKQSLVSQREVGIHTRSFPRALRSALREDPDVIGITDLCDLETMTTAISAAETGHLVVASLHTSNSYRTILRILDAFPAYKREQIRTMLSGALRAVISQQLIPNRENTGVEAACEVLVVNAAVSTLIRENRLHQIPIFIQTGRKDGMRLMDDAIIDLLRERRITCDEGMMRATDPTKILQYRREAAEGTRDKEIAP